MNDEQRLERVERSMRYWLDAALTDDDRRFRDEHFAKAATFATLSIALRGILSPIPPHKDEK